MTLRSKGRNAHRCRMLAVDIMPCSIINKIQKEVQLRTIGNCDVPPPPPREPRCKAAAGVPGAVSFCGMALVTLIRRPSTSVLSIAAIASRSPFSSANMTKPKPRDRPVARSSCTRAPTAPNSRNSVSRLPQGSAGASVTEMRSPTALLAAAQNSTGPPNHPQALDCLLKVFKGCLFTFK